MRRISTSPKYVTEITGLDLLSSVELGGGGNSERIEKMWCL